MKIKNIWNHQLDTYLLAGVKYGWVSKMVHETYMMDYTRFFNRPLTFFSGSDTGPKLRTLLDSPWRYENTTGFSGCMVGQGLLHFNLIIIWKYMSIQLDFQSPFKNNLCPYRSIDTH